MKRICILSVSLICAPLAVGGQEAARPDFEIAQEAVAKGQILPLAEVLARVQAIQPGRVVEVIDIPFARPRQDELYATPEFHALTDRIARVLHGH